MGLTDSDIAPIMSFPICQNAESAKNKKIHIAGGGGGRGKPYHLHLLGPEKTGHHLESRIDCVAS